MTGGVLALHTRPIPVAFNRVGPPPGGGGGPTCGAGSRPPELVTDESFPGCGLGGLGSSHSAPMTGVANRASSPNAVTTHTKTTLHHHIWRTFRG